MKNAELEIIRFDAQDVITTSGGPGSLPLAYATADALIKGEDNFNSLMHGPKYNDSVDAVDYWNATAVSSTIGKSTDEWFEITGVQKSGDGYGVTFNTTKISSKPDTSASIGGSFDDVKKLRAWIVSYLDNSPR